MLTSHSCAWFLLGEAVGFAGLAVDCDTPRCPKQHAPRLAGHIDLLPLGLDEREAISVRLKNDAFEPLVWQVLVYRGKRRIRQKNTVLGSARIHFPIVLQTHYARHIFLTSRQYAPTSNNGQENTRPCFYTHIIRLFYSPTVPAIKHLSAS